MDGSIAINFANYGGFNIRGHSRCPSSGLLHQARVYASNSAAHKVNPQRRSAPTEMHLRRRCGDLDKLRGCRIVVTTPPRVLKPHFRPAPRSRGGRFRIAGPLSVMGTGVAEAGMAARSCARMSAGVGVVRPSRRISRSINIYHGPAVSGVRFKLIGARPFSPSLARWQYVNIPSPER
jgi:hypothetical protein